MLPPEQLLPALLGTAVLLPLASFALILLIGPRLGPHGKYAGFVASGAIVGAAVLSLFALAAWLGSHFPTEAKHHDGVHPHGETSHVALDVGEEHSTLLTSFTSTGAAPHPVLGDASNHPLPENEGNETPEDEGEATHSTENSHHAEPPPAYAGDWYLLGQFGDLRLSIGYYIDSLTIVMFCVVTVIASCIHFYSMGYMHDELHDFHDPEVLGDDGKPLARPGRYHRFFQYMSLFCFSMLGLVVAGNVAQTFVFWELVGICSYFLIGFYIERKSATDAGNKAFIVNRIGDFGMIIGLMVLWAGVGTLHYKELFEAVRPHHAQHGLQTPDGLVQLGGQAELTKIVRQLPPDASRQQIEDTVAAAIPQLRHGEEPGDNRGFGYWLLVVGGIGIFCGCVGKSAQFPLHVWLPDAMEGPTPVSALVHSATMVAAGVFLVGRFYPVFTHEVLLVIAVTGAITLFIAATIAITATDIKRVLAYSTVSQLGYMMLALGLGGWLGGMLHLVTHAFFKSLLFLCSGSVIHAVHTNEMPQMGGLLKKMPYTAYTMLIGCIAIAGFGVPFLAGGIGLSGFYSKDAILEHAYGFMQQTENGLLGSALFYVAAGGAAMTAFYMFRMWFMTFLGKPQDRDRYDHAHESPWVMVVPLLVLAFFAVTVAWQILPIHLVGMLEQARPAGTLELGSGAYSSMYWPDEHASHAPAIKVPATLIALSTAFVGFALACGYYWLGYLDPEDTRRQFAPVYNLLINKWWFDELYHWLFVLPTFWFASLFAAIDRVVIDRFVDGLAWLVEKIARWGEAWIDRRAVDGAANHTANWTYALGSSLRHLQTGRLRQYVMFIVVGTVAVFVVASFLWS